MIEQDRDTLLSAANALDAMNSEQPLEIVSDITTRLRALASRTPEGTVRVRIPVAVTPDAKWRTSCGSGDTPRGAEAESIQALEDAEYCNMPALVVWIEADVPIPQPQTVEGQVTR